MPLDGIVCILLPITPTAMISIPIINSAIPKKIDTNTEPAKGDAVTKKDIAMAKARAPMLNPLAQPGLWLLPTPYTTWEIPRSSKPNPNINITTISVLKVGFKPNTITSALKVLLYSIMENVRTISCIYVIISNVSESKQYRYHQKQGQSYSA
jgi:hypothetical protein